MHKTRFTIFTEFEGEGAYKLELTPSETIFIMAHCPDLNSLADYIRSLPQKRLKIVEAS